MPLSTTLVFAGDSITDSGRDRDDAASLGDGYVALIAHAVGDGATVINKGIGGDRAVDLAARWDDVLAAQPDVLTVYIGVNDMWRRFDSDDPTSAEDFEATVAGLLEAAREAGVEHFVLVEPFFVPVSDGQAAWLEDLDPKRAAVRRLAERFDATLVPLHDGVGAAAAAHGAAAIVPDGVHPTAQGAALIADAWLAAYASVPVGAARTGK
ncbi:GDSL-type esterase/lipase family protein [Microbacterium sp. QXD-8]|uniref:GDSL-type esterase/lipase family protein n=1 Tax=Microbacterium psychrotolerans TaxID=3068321 RepID=A0ABU0YXB2_9MICO|nr:GDSL-type esterase/lipase family protein [Microbacterium sp. QXD-8]MDQ7876965.1 GDSL-type esterase/lipase family protein [Microbacterium sp. QXD-8]